MFNSIENYTESYFENIENKEGNKCEKNVANKRKYLINMIEQGKARVFPGKIPWTVARLEKASENKIKTLYNEGSR